MELATKIIPLGFLILGFFLFGFIAYCHVRFKYSFLQLKYDYLFSFGLIAASILLG